MPTLSVVVPAFHSLLHRDMTWCHYYWYYYYYYYYYYYCIF